MRLITWISHPIRLSGMLAILFLAGPGSLQGLSLLLALTGSTPWVAAGAPQIHALLQTIGFFFLLIWGFLVHGLPGMMGANVLRTGWIRIPMLVTTAGLWMVWGAPAGPGQDTWHNAGWIALFLGTLSGSWVLIAAALQTKGRWLKRPSFMLILPLAVPPLGVLAAWLRPGWLQRGGAEIILTLGVIPVILVMNYRMLPAMLGLQHPHERAFDTGMVLWVIGWGVKIAFVLSPAMALFTDVIVFLASLTLVIALRVAERSRDVFAGHAHPAVDRSLALSLRAGYVFFMLAGLLPLLTGAFTPAARFYVADLARHYLGIGFCLIVVAGITQKLFPVFLRGKPSSAAWMQANFFLLVAGLGLRSAELFLPRTADWVAAGGYCLAAGAMSYALHMLRGMLVPNRTLRNRRAN